jgi:two-component system cell cycle sensor histidine kinase/response regulator CckA
VLEAADGKEALELAEQSGKRIDLLLTDVVMPMIGGRELADSLRKSRPELKVLFMSGYAEDSKGLRIIRKPFSPAVLARKVREALDGRDPPEA